MRWAMLAWGMMAAIPAVVTGCGARERAEKPAALKASAPKEVVVYAALDREFSEPILDQYESKSGVTVNGKYDVESTKTVGLTNLLVTEAASPRCDLFWNNEILNTIRLKEKGLLAPFKAAHTDQIPAEFKDPEGTWFGFAARARILIVNTELVPEAERPKSIKDLVDAKWKGKAGIAKPLFGTTATHAAVLFAAWGDEEAKKYFRAIKDNGVSILSGNKQVAQAVGKGQLAFGMTDTDDAMGELAEGSPVAIVYPDGGKDQLGTLFLPNTIAVIKGGPHPEQAEALASHLLSPEVESSLAEGPSAQIPILTGTPAPARVETPKTVHAMPADFAKAAASWDSAAAFLTELFATN